VIGLRGIGYPYSSDPWARCFSDMPVPALSPEHASQRTLPSTGRLPSTVSAAEALAEEVIEKASFCAPNLLQLLTAVTGTKRECGHRLKSGRN
jgi:hypothetical protein